MFLRRHILYWLNDFDLSKSILFYHWRKFLLLNLVVIDRFLFAKGELIEAARAELGSSDQSQGLLNLIFSSLLPKR
jgi:hypothetical protein